MDFPWLKFWRLLDGQRFQIGGDSGSGGHTGNCI